MLLQAAQTFAFLILLIVSNFFINGSSSSVSVSSENNDIFDPDWMRTCEHYKWRQTGEYPQLGMHILCVKSTRPNAISVSLLKDGHEEFIFDFEQDWGDSYILLSHIYDLIGSSNNRELHLWEVYNEEADILFSIDRMVYEESAFIFTNGHWLWPGVEPGHIQYTQEGYKLTTLSLRPLVFRASNFLSMDECDYIQEAALPYMRPSGTSKMDKDRHLPDTEWRTSTQHFLESRGHPIVQSIDRRTALLTKSSVRQQEYVQVLRYYEGQKYDQHTDYFDVRYYQKDPETLRNIKNGEKNRLITVLWYLSTVTDGGHTVFPRSFGSVPINSSDCSSETALKVNPVKGDVIIFYSLTADGGLDPLSLHGACPVGPGNVKWAANKWVWTEDAGFL